jgi:hypothetical protein
VPTADHADHDDEAKEQKGVDEPNDGEIRPELGLFAS